MSSRPNPNPLDLKPGYLNWWQSLLLAFSCTLVGLIGAYSAMSGVGVPGAPDVSWGKDLLKLTPHALLLFGLMADAITYDGVYWTSTIVGLSAAGLHSTLETITNSLITLINNIFKNIMTASGTEGAASRPSGGGTTMHGGGDYDGCSVTGAERGIPDGFRTAQTLVVTVSVVSYFFFDLWFNRGIINAIGILVAGILLLIGEAMAISPTCFPVADKDKRTITSGVLYAMVFGTMIGSGFYSFFQAFYPMYLPSTVIPLQNYASQVASISSTGFVYVPGQGLVSVNSPAGQQAVANGTATSPDDMAKALDATGTLGSGKEGEEKKCS